MSIGKKGWRVRRIPITISRAEGAGALGDARCFSFGGASAPSGMSLPSSFRSNLRSTPRMPDMKNPGTAGTVPMITRARSLPPGAKIPVEFSGAFGSYLMRIDLPTSIEYHPCKYGGPVFRECIHAITPWKQAIACFQGAGHSAALHAFFLYPQSQYGPPPASVYCRIKSEAPPVSLMV